MGKYEAITEARRMADKQVEILRQAMERRAQDNASQVKEPIDNKTK